MSVYFSVKYFPPPISIHPLHYLIYYHHHHQLNHSAKYYYHHSSVRLFQPYLPAETYDMSHNNLY